MAFRKPSMNASSESELRYAWRSASQFVLASSTSWNTCLYCILWVDFHRNIFLVRLP